MTPPKSQRVAFAASILILLTAIGFLGQRVFHEERRGPAGTVALGDEPLGEVYLSATLYFGDPNSSDLVAERHDIPARAEEAGNVAEVLSGLATGPLANLLPVLPAGTEVRHVFLGSKGSMFVDFSKELTEGFSGGLSREILALRALARTLIFNFPETRTMQILVEGEPVPTLGGHVDTSRPLVLADWN